MRKDLVQIDALQRFIAGLIARSPAGVNLLLVGGFRYRLLDGSQRLSIDIDYHWEGDLDAKQLELLNFLKKVVVPEVRRRFKYDGSADARKGPDAQSTSARFIDLAFWKPGERLEVPVEIIRILRMDPPAVRTSSGSVFPTASDTDLVESKIIAVFGRPFLQHRDLIDIFFFQDALREDSKKRLKLKFKESGLASATVARRVRDLAQNAAYHASAIQKVIDEQVEGPVARQLTEAGGGQTVLKAALEAIIRVLPQ